MNKELYELLDTLDGISELECVGIKELNQILKLNGMKVEGTKVYKTREAKKIYGEYLREYFITNNKKPSFSSWLVMEYGREIDENNLDECERLVGSDSVECMMQEDGRSRREAIDTLMENQWDIYGDFLQENNLR